MSGIESAESAREAAVARKARAAGAWAGYLIFGLCLLVFIAFDVQAGYNHEWSRLAGTIVLTLAFVTIPTGGAKWLRRELQRRRAR